MDKAKSTLGEDWKEKLCTFLTWEMWDPMPSPTAATIEETRVKYQCTHCTKSDLNEVVCTQSKLCIKKQ